jgi:hypothetical protein
LPIPTTESQIRVIGDAITALNSGKSLTDICSILSKSPAFKKVLTKSTEFKVPEPITKVRQNVVATNEEKKGDTELLGKRKEPEDGKTKAGTKDITSFFAPKRPAHTSSSAASISCASESHHALCDEIIAYGVSSPVMGQENIFE